ncbi:MAG TPA: M48 family metallopeptidase [Dokdonella sp.]|uniref:M48 family metallopeptidase n=1 Tax=Dokdonella sp. TaxID=2291710 RepID=UPI002D7FB190|nr:M48 family metallopeptidase [Dokdonella sp.]HET9031627.1 M48 family metallopeptidase [Dokdonella sp.]
MNAFKASYFDGLTSRQHDVEVQRVDASTVRVIGDNIDRSDPISSLRISSRLARTTRTIAFSDGARIFASDHELLDRWFPAEDRLQRIVDRLERHAHAVAASIVVCLAMAIFTFAWGVPWLADRIAAQVPPSVETRLGDEVLGQLDRFFGFSPSTLDPSRKTGLSARFARLSSELPGNENYRLAFRNAPGIGPNALAIPGGTIVITDQLVTLFDDDREFDAVVAHELGHQQHRHALRQTLRSSFVLVIAALFTGDVSSASAIVIGIPTFLLQSHYSRGFEEEADQFAFSTLAAHNTSPAWFAAAMRNLDEHHGAAKSGDRDIAYLSSHPSTPSRIAAAEASGEQFIASHPELIRETPGYDACEEEGICAEDDLEDCDNDDCLYPAESFEWQSSEVPGTVDDKAVIDSIQKE